jgi:hypothetical protein
MVAKYCRGARRDWLITGGWEADLQPASIDEIARKEEDLFYGCKNPTKENGCQKEAFLSFGGS